jgi:hypothetical protein
MKSFIGYLLFAMVLVVMGIYTTSLHENILLAIAGFIIALCGVILFIGSITVWIGLIHPKIYRYIHLFKQADILDNNTQLVKKLTAKDIAQLRRRQENMTVKQIFAMNPVIEDIRSTVKINGWAYTKVWGWIYATDEAEAKRTLHYHQFSDPDDEDNTPLFFKPKS